jgi:hypothetical protein
MQIIIHILRSLQKKKKEKQCGGFGVLTVVVT